MAESQREESTDAWVTSTAVVIDYEHSCSPFLDESTPKEEIYEIATFVIHFSYEANGKTFYGHYLSGVPREDGYSFEILYDPKKPERNTASEGPDGWTERSVWQKVLTVALFILVILIVIAFENH